MMYATKFLHSYWKWEQVSIKLQESLATTMNNNPYSQQCIIAHKMMPLHSTPKMCTETLLSLSLLQKKKKITQVSHILQWACKDWQSKLIMLYWNISNQQHFASMMTDVTSPPQVGRGCNICHHTPLALQIAVVFAATICMLRRP